MSDVPLQQLVRSADAGDARARQQLFVTLYNELRRMAERQLRRNSALTLSPTTLLHETFLSMSGNDSAVFADQSQFMAYAARAMRGLLIDYIRSRMAQKRGGEFEITALPTEIPESMGTGIELERMNDALETLQKSDPRLAQLVDLKFFCGFSFAEIGGILGLSERTAKRDWDKARLFLHGCMKDANIGS